MKLFSQGWSDGTDGPGMRWILYCKGCNFCCKYCGNPESIHPETEVMFYRGRVGRLAPEKCCPHQMDCAHCTTFECVRVWHHPAFEISGMELSLNDFLKRLAEVRHMIDGVSFGGGEPTLQIKELLTFLDALRERKIHTAVESNASTQFYPELLGRANLVISDCKAGSPEAYRRLTGGNVDRVFDNLRMAAAGQKDLLLRVPLIPGYNTNDSELKGMADFLGSLRRMRPQLNVQVLALHHAGEAKYAALNREYPVRGVVPPNRAMMDKFEKMLQDKDINTVGFHQEKSK